VLTAANFGLHVEVTAMPQQDVLDDRQPKPGAASFSRSALVNSIKALS
jgi:hypothetical protein